MKNDKNSNAKSTPNFMAQHADSLRIKSAFVRTPINQKTVCHVEDNTVISVARSQVT